LASVSCIIIPGGWYPDGINSIPCGSLVFGVDCFGSLVVLSGESAKSAPDGFIWFLLGDWLSRVSPILDYRCSSHGLDGSTLVSQFSDRAFLLGVYYPLGDDSGGALGGGDDGVQFTLNRQGAKFRTVNRVLVGIALWCGLEAFWTLGDLNWTSLAYTQSPHNLWILHLGQISGPFTVTAAVVAVNGLIAEAGISYFSNRTQRVTGSNAKQNFILALGLLIGFHLIGFGLYSRPLIQPTQAAFKVGIIQGNIPNRIKLYRDGWSRAIENYTKGYNALADKGVEAVLTPETALPFLWDEQINQFRSPVPFYQYKLDRLKEAILDKGVLIWLGAFGEKGDSLTNSLFTITGTGETISRYNKVILVPLGEYIPFEELLGSLIDRLSPLDAHLAAGQPNQQFATPFGRAIAGICYESAFAYHFRHQAARGGEFILSASNNAHYSETMPAQHHAQDVMRAIETDRWAVRATNTGYSGIVDPHGRTLWLSGINTYQIHAATVYRRQTQTLYVRWGNWLTPTLIGLAMLAFIVSR